MITRVKLKNFRSHLDSELTFSKGTNALVGILGSGKSTVMNALCFGLFGTFPDLQARKVKLDDIIMNKPFVKDSAEVVVDFTVDGKNYSVLRVIERGKGTTYSEIREGDKLLDAPNSQRVTELVEKILKVNYELFSKAIYSEQNALDYFLTLPRGERMRRIDNLLTIDKFELARSSAVTLRNKLIDRKLGKQSIIDQTDLEELKKNLADLEYSLKGLKESKAKVSSDLEVLNKKKIELEKKLEKLEKLNKDLTSLRQEERSLQSAIEENKKVIEEIERLLKGEKPERVREKLKILSEKLEKLEDELAKKRSEYERLTKLISEAKARIEFLEKEKIKRLNEEVSKKLELQKELVEIKKKYGEKPDETLKEEREELERIDNELATITTKLTETQEILERIFELKDQCPVCLSKLTETKKKKLIEEQQKKIEDMNEKLREMEKKKKTKEERVKILEEITEKFKQFLREVADLEDLQSQLKNSKKEYEELLRLTEENEKVFTEMKNEIAKCEETIEDEKSEKQNLELIVSRLADFERMKSRLAEFESKEKTIKKRISEVIEEIGDQDIEKIRKDFLEVTSKKSELEERVKSLENLIAEKESRKKEYEEKLKLIETQKKDVAKLEKIIKDLRVFEKALERTQVQLRTEFIDAVNYTMNEIWPHLYPYGDFSGIALNIEGGDYTLQLRTRSGDWINVDGIASGGERSLACLALRIAFSLVLAPNLKMLILDEPTANLDSRSISELATTLRERINEFVDQTFLISHQRELEDAVTGRGYRIERNKEEDGVSIVKPIQ
jgi:exonuclease SbcC